MRGCRAGTAWRALPRVFLEVSGEGTVSGISGNEKGGVRAPPFRNFRGVNYAALSCAFALRQIILSKTEKDKPKISETIVDRAMP